MLACGLAWENPPAPCGLACPLGFTHARKSRHVP